MNKEEKMPEGFATTQKIKKILVPVDYSECSDFACHYAIKIACKVGAELKLLHTYYSPAFDLIELAGAVQTQAHLKEEVMVNLEQSEKETVENYVEELKRYIKDSGFPEIKVGYEILPGVPEDEIIRFSETYKPDLVVMGTHGKGTGMGAIMGSVTVAVIKRIAFPIMSIPVKYTFVGEKNVKNILYVTEFDESDFMSLKKLMNITEQFDFDIHCVHITEDPGSWDRVKMEGLMEYFRKSYGKSQVQYSFVSPKNLLEDLDQKIRDLKINILSLTSHRRKLFERLFKPDITKKLFYHTSIPLLVFHS
ncbi:MAG: universal stress protein [Bacteroidales bacterium]|nr:universal stress protein [Bacteroidales bacterium]